MSQQMPVALITGGASGIGWACARRLGRSGFRVALADCDEEALEKLEKGSDGLELQPFAVDVSQRSQVNELVRSVVSRFSRLDAVVNNAGVLGPSGFLESSDEDLARVLAVNALGPLWVCKYAIPALKESGGGAVVNIASASALAGAPAYPAYAASKAALVGLTRSLARGYGGCNIRFNCLCPGSVTGTDLLRRSRGHNETPVEKLQLLRQIPLKRLSNAEDMAQIVEFLLSPAAGAISGAVIVADAGEMLGC